MFQDINTAQTQGTQKLKLYFNVRSLTFFLLADVYVRMCTHVAQHFQAEVGKLKDFQPINTQGAQVSSP